MSGSALNPFPLPEPHARSFLTASHKRLLWAVGGISIFTNLLMLTGPVFMLQVYDRVLSGRSEATLVVLLLLAGFLYLILGLLDHARARIAARVGAQIQQALDRVVFAAALRAGSARQGDVTAARAPQDLSMLQQIASAPVFMALFDAPWVPLFLIVIAMLHPALGMVALGAALGLVVLGAAAISTGRSRVDASLIAAHRSDQTARQIAQGAQHLKALGMQENALARWQRLREDALSHAIAAQDHSGRFGAGVRAVRLFLQSAILAMGAWLVLRSELAPGAMIAASIILGRALAPLDQLIGGWPQFQAGLAAIRRLRGLIATAPQMPHRTVLPAPQGALSVRDMALQVQGANTGTKTLLQGISFDLRPGQALGVIGPSGAGKSTLAEVIAGSLPKTTGEIRLGGARFEAYHPDQLQRAIGYLPQRVTLFEGSLRDNIARLAPDATDDAVIAAAQAAGAHEMILSLPQAYDTLIRADGSGLSGGQAQRIALARTLFGDPVLLVLDEPNASLDEPGERALNAAIRAAKQRGAAVVIMAHRPSAIVECDLLLKLDQGRATAFGPTNDILRKVARNSAEVLRPVAQRPFAHARPATLPEASRDWRGAEGAP